MTATTDWAAVNNASPPDFNIIVNSAPSVLDAVNSRGGGYITVGGSTPGEGVTVSLDGLPSTVWFDLDVLISCRQPDSNTTSGQGQVTMQLNESSLKTFSVPNGSSFADRIISHTPSESVNAHNDLGSVDLQFKGPHYYDVDYVAIRVTYSPAPNAPTLGAPDGEIVDTTPTMEFSTSNPSGGDTITDTRIEVRRVSDNAEMWDSGWVSNLSSIAYAGTTLAFDTQYEWRARNRNEYDVTSAWSPWQTFTIVESRPPSASIVSPSGTTADLTPLLNWSYSDPDGDAQAAYQVQVRRVSDQVLMWDPGQQFGSSSSVTYAGTALVNETQYEWRVRVQDTFELWSDYTSWTSFTTSAIPQAPSDLTPSGLTNSLTPTISGTYNQGDAGAEESYQYQVRQSTTTIYDSGEIVGAIGTGQAYGTDNPSDSPSTPPALSWGTSYSIRVRSKDTSDNWGTWSNWQAFNTNAAPTTPTNLQPDGSITGDTTPDLSWQHNDPDGDAQTELEVELRKVSDDSIVTGYGPKSLTQSAQSHTVTETLTDDPSTDYKFRVRTKGTSGPGFSPWSAFVSFTVAQAPTVTLDSPSAGATLTSAAVSVQWTYSGSTAQSTWRLIVYASDQVTVVHDTGVQSGTDTSYTIPSGTLENGKTYYIEVTVEDGNSVEGKTGKVQVTTDWTPPAAIAGLSISPVGSQ